MFNVNSGYVGASRSVRSQEAVDSFEVPVSMINKSLIEDFLNESEEDFSKVDLNYLEKVSVSKWKYIAKERVSASSWHHTSSYFNKTNHYDLNAIAEKILEIKDTLDEEYKAYQESQKKEGTDVKYGVIKVQVWGGSRKRPKYDVQNYGIHYDEKMKRWLFIIEDSKGIFTTFIYDKNIQKYKTNTIKYTTDIGNICFNNKIIFKPSDKTIRGFSYDKNIYKDFQCDVVNEDSKLIRKDNKFIVINEKEIYKVG